MNAFVLAAICVSSPPEPPDFFVDIAIRHGDPLAAPGDKSIAEVSNPCTMLHAKQPGSVFLGSTKEEAPIALHFTVTPRDRFSVDFKAKFKVRINERSFEKEVNTQVMHSKALNIRIGSFSDDEQVWAAVNLFPCKPNLNKDEEWSAELLLPSERPQAFPSPAAPR